MIDRLSRMSMALSLAALGLFGLQGSAFAQEEDQNRA